MKRERKRSARYHQRKKKRTCCTIWGRSEKRRGNSNKTAGEAKYCTVSNTRKSAHAENERGEPTIPALRDEHTRSGTPGEIKEERKTPKPVYGGRQEGVSIAGVPRTGTRKTRAQGSLRGRAESKDARDSKLLNGT